MIGDGLIRSFANKTTEELFHGDSTAKTRRLSKALRAATLAKLDILNAAICTQDLSSPPGNRFEELRGSFAGGGYSIRVNDQWRLVFHFEDCAAYDVQLIDYHH